MPDHTQASAGVCQLLLSSGDVTCRNYDGFPRPTVMSISSDGTFALIATYYSEQIGRIDLRSHQVTATYGGLRKVSYGGVTATWVASIAVSPDDSFALIGHWAIGIGVAVLDLATGVISYPFPSNLFSWLFNLNIASDGSFAIVSNRNWINQAGTLGSRNVLRIDLSGGWKSLSASAVSALQCDTSGTDLPDCSAQSVELSQDMSFALFVTATNDYVGGQTVVKGSCDLYRLEIPGGQVSKVSERSPCGGKMLSGAKFLPGDKYVLAWGGPYSGGQLQHHLFDRCPAPSPTPSGSNTTTAWQWSRAKATFPAYWPQVKLPDGQHFHEYSASIPAISSFALLGFLYRRKIGKLNLQTGTLSFPYGTVCTYPNDIAIAPDSTFAIIACGCISYGSSGEGVCGPHAKLQRLHLGSGSLTEPYGNVKAEAVDISSDGSFALFTDYYGLKVGRIDLATSEVTYPTAMNDQSWIKYIGPSGIRIAHDMSFALFVLYGHRIPGTVGQGKICRIGLNTGTISYPYSGLIPGSPVVITPNNKFGLASYYLAGSTIFRLDLSSGDTADLYTAPALTSSGVGRFSSLAMSRDGSLLLAADSTQSHYFGNLVILKLEPSSA